MELFSEVLLTGGLWQKGLQWTQELLKEEVRMSVSPQCKQIERDTE